MSLIHSTKTSCDDLLVGKAHVLLEGVLGETVWACMIDGLT